MQIAESDESEIDLARVPEGLCGKWMRLDQHNIRRAFRQITKAAGLGEDWVPRELHHTFVSIMSAGGVPIEEIARLAGHQQTSTTKLVYRRELRPVITTGAEIMDRIFSA